MVADSRSLKRKVLMEAFFPAIFGAAFPDQHPPKTNTGIQCDQKEVGANELWSISNCYVPYPQCYDS